MLDSHLSLPIREPVKLESQKGKPTLHTRMKAAKPEDLGLFRRHFQTELSEPFRQRSVEAFGIFFETKRTHEIIGIAAHHGLAAYLLLCHFLKPEIERIV
ncbi:MAG TPA: hypothetical protein VE844_09665 [Gammaproteobacteria bacterium]|nr:hypothetical protein [Gammaproteobacteria bacterium]